MNALIDTCIVIDALQSREPFFDDAQKIFIAAASRKITGFITAKSVTDIYYLTHRFIHDTEETKNVISKLFSIFEVTDTSAKSCKRAINSAMNDYEDAVMVETAYENRMDCIVTRNLKDYTHSSVPVYSPSDFLEIISEEQDGTQK